MRVLCHTGIHLLLKYEHDKAIMNAFVPKPWDNPHNFLCLPSGTELKLVHISDDRAICRIGDQLVVMKPSWLRFDAKMLNIL